MDDWYIAGFVLFVVSGFVHRGSCLAIIQTIERDSEAAESARIKHMNIGQIWFGPVSAMEMTIYTLRRKPTEVSNEDIRKLLWVAKVSFVVFATTIVANIAFLASLA